MKYKSLGLTLLFAAFAGSSLAQTRVSGATKCPKSDTTYTVEIGDQAGHVLILEKGSCTWSTPLEMAGLKSTGYTGADSVDVTGAQGQSRGYVTITMDNGDKAYVRWQAGGTATKEGSVTGEGTWSYTGGTGKLKGLKGKGTFKFSTAPDGTSEAQIEGGYSLPEAGTTTSKK
jgi:hypothetical protein